MSDVGLVFEGLVYRTEKRLQLDWTGLLCNRTFGPVALGLDQLQLHEDCKTGWTDKKNRLQLVIHWTIGCSG